MGMAERVGFLRMTPQRHVVESDAIVSKDGVPVRAVVALTMCIRDGDADHLSKVCLEPATVERAIADAVLLCLQQSYEKCLYGELAIGASAPLIELVAKINSSPLFVFTVLHAVVLKLEPQDSSLAEASLRQRRLELATLEAFLDVNLRNAQSQVEVQPEYVRTAVDRVRRETDIGIKQKVAALAATPGGTRTLFPDASHRERIEAIRSSRAREDALHEDLRKLFEMATRYGMEKGELQNYREIIKKRHIPKEFISDNGQDPSDPSDDGVQGQSNGDWRG